ncbi:uncharacterized protein LOC129596562 isoform X2 [Paramacrobiotus metropolitanus]|uniref:uncharacterized protein LOC129596562 isoform X2 n=1 Tax=Paramacrobiotus metropolitanus TaxID=2943436 RepID=UPI002445C75D|nr:uncharacterized protein LOC129596562 isoform X2 [Paramacrobiotus metropolitanus]
MEIVIFLSSVTATECRWLGVFVDFLSEKGVRRSYKALGMWFFLPWLSEASMILSDWTLVVFSWERLRVILSPFRFGFLQRVATARILIVVIVILSLACFMHEFAYAYCNWVNRPSGPSYNPTAYAWVHSWHRLHNLALLVVRIFTFVLILIPGVILIAFLARQRQSEFVERVARKTQGIRETCQHRPASLCRNTESTSSC